uniref:Uncharacterized protein n=1 Tax=Glossina morsitans morsitans TaxID=37546 RepID=A0A1B0G3F4_GLOMM
MDSRKSFEEVVRLRENILETKWAALNTSSGFKKKTLPKIPMILAGNKCDREPRMCVFGAPSPLPPHSSAGGSKKNALSIKRRFSDACGVVTPNARRPSIRTDLNLMRSKTMAMSEGDGSSARKKCIIM